MDWNEINDLLNSQIKENTDILSGYNQIKKVLSDNNLPIPEINTNRILTEFKNWLVEVLEKEPSRDREEIFIEFLNRWTNFFNNFGNKRLSILRQQGLFGELWWIKLMLEKNIPALETLSSWKGCEGSYHDFDFEGHIVEVKTTMTKEPRKVTICLN